MSEPLQTLGAALYAILMAFFLVWWLRFWSK